MSILQEGFEIESVTLPSGQVLEVGNDDVESIDVADQRGDMGMIPYVRVIYCDKSTLLIDARQCHGIASAAPSEAA